MNKPNRTIFQLHVRLLRIEPAIWRRIQVWQENRLPQLHRILQLLFNWEDYHLHEFVVGSRVYSVPDPEDAFHQRKVINEKSVPLSRVLKHVGDKFVYCYDFGDGWDHEILLEAILLPDAEAGYPHCLSGARSGPPEDAGGAVGYAGYLQALADPHHPEHEAMLAWRGPFDPEAFSLDAVNAALESSFPRWPTSAIRAGEPRLRGPSD